MSKSLGLITEEGRSTIPMKKPKILNSKKAFNPYALEEKEEINEINWSNDGSVFCLALGNGEVRILDSRDLKGLGSGTEKENQGLAGMEVDVGGANGIEEKKEEKDKSREPINWPVAKILKAHSANIFCVEFENGGR